MVLLCRVLAFRQRMGTSCLPTAWHRSQVCRTLPWVISKFKLDELTTVRELQKVVERRFRENGFVRDPRVRAAGAGACPGRLPALRILTAAACATQAIDLLIFKGKEELDVRAPRRVLVLCTVPRPTASQLPRRVSSSHTAPYVTSVRDAQMVQRQHKQRHHLINDYVSGPMQERAAAELEKKENLSSYMKSFYINAV